MSHPASSEGAAGEPDGQDADERLRDRIRKLVLMKETGPKSAAWHRARVQTIWRLQRKAEALAGQQDEGEQSGEQ